MTVTRVGTWGGMGIISHLTHNARAHITKLDKPPHSSPRPPLTQNQSATEARSLEPEIAESLDWWRKSVEGWPDYLEIENLTTGKRSIIDLRSTINTPRPQTQPAPQWWGRDED